MADLSTHYKERLPEETIQIISDFFTSHGFTIKIDNNDAQQSEAGTWYCHLSLYNKDVIIGQTNGKGMTREYALASGYAELYERFCNYWFIASPYWSKSVIDQNKEKGYNFRPTEKILTKDEQLSQLSMISLFFDTFTRNKELVNEILDYITDNKIIGLPYKNINGTNEIYLDQRLAVRLTRTVGMAAGNNETEALVQGISEIIEKEAFLQVLSNPETTLYALDLTKIEDNNLKNIINNIQNNGYNIYLFDLSYTYNIPAMMSLLLDQDNGYININFGSFPIFEIAAERVLTELYQGIQSYKTKERLSMVREPYKLYQQPQYILSKYGNTIDGTCLPVDYLKNIQFKSIYNSEIFLNKNSTNEQCLKYLINLLDKLNIELYYSNNSLIKEMSAISIVTSENIKYNGLTESLLGVSDHLQENALKQLMKLYSQLFNDIYNSKFEQLHCLDLFNSFNYLINLIGSLNFWYIFLQHYLFISETPIGDFKSLLQVIEYNGQIKSLPLEIVESPIYKQYKKYYLLQLYSNTNKYTTDEQLTIFNKYFNFNITNQDINNIFNRSYLIQQIYIEPMIKYIHSDDYLKIIKIFVDSY